MCQNRVEVVAGIMFDSAGRVLLIRRPTSPVPEWSEVWSHCGGKIDRGETPETALVREWWEELDQAITVQSGPVHETIETSSSGVHYRVRFYRVTQVGEDGARTSPEVMGVCWWRREEALMLPLTPGCRTIILATMPPEAKE